MTTEVVQGQRAHCLVAEGRVRTPLTPASSGDLTSGAPPGPALVSQARGLAPFHTLTHLLSFIPKPR